VLHPFLRAQAQLSCPQPYHFPSHRFATSPLTPPFRALAPPLQFRWGATRPCRGALWGWRWSWLWSGFSPCRSRRCSLPMLLASSLYLGSCSPIGSSSIAISLSGSPPCPPPGAPPLIGLMILGSRSSCLLPLSLCLFFFCFFCCSSISNLIGPISWRWNACMIR
jgi:hypothetical protein